ncbi:MAG TPA: alcohol dehydrogenase catalytic domain-containing protein [Gaiellaceae bacterium]|jgi:L-iditol 2-dehydrogenase
MRAVALDAYGEPRLSDLPVPEPSIEVLACGLCGSDVEKIGSAPAGTVLGHEVVARVNGARVALVHHRPCGECERCRAGHESTCERFAEATIVPGGFAERVRPADGVELPDGIDDARGTYVEPLACVLRALELVPRGQVLVLGCGFVGQLWCAVLRRRGDEVFALDLRADRRCAPEPDGPLPAVVVCAPADAAEWVAPGGTLLVFAPGAVVDADAVYRRELTVHGSRSATPEAMADAVRVLCTLDVPEPVVLPLERFDEGLDLYRRGGALKVVFTP